MTRHESATAGRTRHWIRLRVGYSNTATTRTALLALVLIATVIAGTPVPALAYDFEWLGKIELDAEGLAHSDPQRRARAAHALGKYDIALVKPYLLRALRDSNRSVATIAGRVLARNHVAEAAPVVIEWLNHPDVELKKTAADILAELGTKQAVAALIRTLGDVDPEVRVRAVLALGRIGTPAVVVPLVGRLEDDKANVRALAIEQLRAIGDARAVIPVVSAFNDPSVEVRVAAVKAVGDLGDSAAVPALLRQVNDGLPAIRNAAIVSIGNLGATDAVDMLVAMLEQSNTSAKLRANIAYALGKIALGHPPDRTQGTSKMPRNARTRAGKQPSVTPQPSPVSARRNRRKATDALVKALATPALQGSAREALRTAGITAVPSLVAHLEGRIAGDPELVVMQLRDLGTQAATPALIDELTRGRIAQGLVLSALAASHDSRALMPVLALLSSADATVRLRAMKALEPLLATVDTESSGRAADVIRRLLDDPNFEIRVLAVRHLGRLHSTRAAESVIALLEPGHENRLRAAAIDAVGTIGDVRAIPPLLRLLEKGAVSLRIQAANALIYIGGAAVTPASKRAVHDLTKSLLAMLKEHPRSAPRALRVLGGVLRDRRNDDARRVIERHAKDGRLEEALAAIDALGSMADVNAAPFLREVTESPERNRRRAALRALANVRDLSSRERLRAALRDRDDRTSAIAALGLGRLGATNAFPELLNAAKRRGWATAVNASAALTLLATGKLPRRAATDNGLRQLLHHRLRFVRANAAEAIARHRVTSAIAPLQTLLAEDESALVRVASARALSRLNASKSREAVRSALQRAAAKDLEPSVRQAAAAALKGPFVPAPRTDWRSFRIVDPDDGDAPVRQEPYFVAGNDNVVTAFYSDARGHALLEAFPVGAFSVAAKSSGSEY